MNAFLFVGQRAARGLAVLVVWGPGEEPIASEIARRSGTTLAPPTDLALLAGLMRAEGLSAKISSIHVNGWFGSYDKLAMSKRLLAEEFGCRAAQLRKDFAFAGDSPNDAPMFAFFDHSIGVANVTRFKGKLEAEPKYVTRGAAGAGFAELAAHLLAHFPPRFPSSP